MLRLLTVDEEEQRLRDQLDADADALLLAAAQPALRYAKQTSRCSCDGAEDSAGLAASVCAAST